MENLECGGLYTNHVDVQRVKKQSSVSYTCNDVKTVQKALKEGQLKQVKEIIRGNHWPMDHPIRRELWPFLCEHHGKEKFLTGFYEETLEEVLGSSASPTSLPSFVDPSYCMNYYLNPVGKKNTVRVMYAVSRIYPDITYCPLIYPLASIFMHYMPEDRVFHCICNMIASKNKNFISRTRNMHEEQAFVMQKLTKKFAKSAFNQLEQEIKEKETMQKVFFKWQWWIFKSLCFSYLVRVIDCFLLDGSKALYRISLAIILSYSKQSGTRSELLGGGISERIVEFCSDIPVGLEKLIKIAYSFRRLSGSLVHQQLLKARMTIKSQNSGRNRSASLDCLPISESSSRLETSSLDIEINNSNVANIPGRTMSVGMVPLGKFISDILTQEQIISIWNWLPPRITILLPQLIYSSNEHGCCLTAFYMKVDSWEPIVLIIKTDANEVFGAYCSTDLSGRYTQDSEGNRQIYFGTGETFLFTFAPETRKYPWVGMEEKEDVHHSKKLFICATNKMICIGSGDGQGLWLDESLTVGRTETCATFNNLPLCSSVDFKCSLIEVFGFK